MNYYIEINRKCNAAHIHRNGCTYTPHQNFRECGEDFMGPFDSEREALNYAVERLRMRTVTVGLCCRGYKLTDAPH